MFRSRLSNRPRSEATPREIRSHAATVAGRRPKVCVRCGYNKHAEVCHIQAVSAFAPGTLVREINAPDNLVMLCPNCHWEFDHEMFDRTELQGVESNHQNPGYGPG